MPPDIICLGELLAELLRTEVNMPHGKIGLYKGPFPSGAPAIFIDCAARMSKSLKFSTGYIGVIGDDEFGGIIVEMLGAKGGFYLDAATFFISGVFTKGVSSIQCKS